MKTTKKATTNATTTERPFAKLLTAYANDPTNAKTLQDLATATAFAVVKKIVLVSADPTITKTRQSMARDLHNIDRIAYASENAFDTVFTKDGDRKTVVKDKDLANALTDLCKESFDGLDLVQDAVLAILDETAKQRERDPEKPLDLERPYTVRQLKRKVYIKTADSVNGWETVTTTPIQQIYKAVCRSVEAQRHERPNRNGYTYLEEIATDPETDIDTVIYRRFGKYADIGGYATDANGKETFYTTDAETVKDLDTLIASLNLTAKQATVLSLRQQGHGERAIATYLGVSPQAVQKTLKQIQVKAVAIGLTPTK